ncbi:mitochondrial ribosomal protein subunit L20-domain-containing protein [Xylogone sp. PMI_703]|nr:mitochondrial ribosomal protein subunit L20-domain-containing protein [Xylogone sp. PMI_703]
MEARLVRRPVSDLLSGNFHRSLSITQCQRRNESSYRRTKQRLNVAPDASFLPSLSSPKTDHIIFNPPSSAPSVLHTPLRFLPKEDKRRQLLTSNSPTSATTIGRNPFSSRLPPLVKRPNPSVKRHHLSEADVEEMRQLYSSDPEQWTRTKLAKKFNCSALFVRICCEASKEKKEAEMAKLEAVKARWGPKRRMAREDRAKRRELAFLGDE